MKKIILFLIISLLAINLFANNSLNFLFGINNFNYFSGNTINPDININYEYKMDKFSSFSGLEFQISEINLCEKALFIPLNVTNSNINFLIGTGLLSHLCFYNSTGIEMDNCLAIKLNLSLNKTKTLLSVEGGLGLKTTGIYSTLNNSGFLNDFTFYCSFLIIQDFNFFSLKTGLANGNEFNLNITMAPELLFEIDIPLNQKITFSMKERVFYSDIVNDCCSYVGFLMLGGIKIEL